ncbi:Uncharacterised protein [Bordetella pertussis]|nr:Uncharacterised protein [Bordetella pertussis]
MRCCSSAMTRARSPSSGRVIGGISGNSLRAGEFNGARYCR